MSNQAASYVPFFSSTCRVVLLLQDVNWGRTVAVSGEKWAKWAKWATITWLVRRSDWHDIWHCAGYPMAIVSSRRKAAEEHGTWWSDDALNWARRTVPFCYPWACRLVESPGQVQINMLLIARMLAVQIETTISLFSLLLHTCRHVNGCIDPGLIVEVTLTFPTRSYIHVPMRG